MVVAREERRVGHAVQQHPRERDEHDAGADRTPAEERIPARLADAAHGSDERQRDDRECEDQRDNACIDPRLQHQVVRRPDLGGDAGEVGGPLVDDVISPVAEAEAEEEMVGEGIGDHAPQREAVAQCAGREQARPDREHGHDAGDARGDDRGSGDRACARAAHRERDQQREQRQADEQQQRGLGPGGDDRRDRRDGGDRVQHAQTSVHHGPRRHACDDCEEQRRRIAVEEYATRLRRVEHVLEVRQGRRIEQPREQAPRCARRARDIGEDAEGSERIQRDIDLAARHERDVGLGEQSGDGGEQVRRLERGRDAEDDDEKCRHDHEGRGRGDRGGDPLGITIDNVSREQVGRQQRDAEDHAVARRADLGRPQHRDDLPRSESREQQRPDRRGGSEVAQILAPSPERDRQQRAGDQQCCRREAERAEQLHDAEHEGRGEQPA